MSTHTIQVSETTYLRLCEQAAHFQLTLEQLVERLLMPNLQTMIETHGDAVEPLSQTNSVEALAAVQRLATCFADVVIPDLEATLKDPMIALSHANNERMPLL